MEMIVTINYHYTGRWSAIMKAIVEKHFMDIYNEWVDLVNPHYEEWNEEWNALCPDAQIDVDAENEWFHKYSNFIAEKAKPLEDELNERKYRNGKWYDKLFKIHNDPKTGSAKVIDRNHEGRYVTFDMTPIKK